MIENNAMMQNRGAETKVSKGRCFYWYLAGMIFLFCGQILVFGAYLFGATDFFGTNINPVSAIVAIVSVFSLRRAGLYRYLVKCALSVFYLILLILMLKWLIQRTFSFGKMFRKKTDEDAWAFYYLSEDAFWNTFWLFLFFQLFTCLFARGGRGGGTIMVWVIACIFCLYDGFISEFRKEQRDLSAIFLSVCKNATAAILFCLINFLLVEPFGENVIDGLGILFDGYLGFSDGWLNFLYGLLSNLIMPILGCVMAFWLFSLMKWYFFENNHRFRLARLRAFLIFCTVVTVAVMLFKAGIAYNNASMFFSNGLFSRWYYSVRDFYLPFTLAVAGLFAVEALGGKQKKVP